MILTPILSLLIMQVGMDPSRGAMPDYSAEVQDRPPPTEQVSQEDPAGLVAAQDDGWLKQCLELVETAPARAHVQAQLRRDSTVESERVIANYCLGMASSELQRWGDAQTAFVAARDEVGSADPRMRARFGAMAGNAALVSGNPATALALLTEARRDAETAGASDLAAIAAIDQARVMVANGQYDTALSALSDARALAPQSSEAVLLSATLMRRMDQLDEAQAMIEHAAELAPNNPDIALEAGVIAVLSGRDEAARASWQSVIALDPISTQADVARGYLAQLGEAVPTP